MADRVILHVDMDAFFASVEQRDDPALRGKPVLVGGRGKRGVVAAASYEARRFGCRSAQPMAVALRHCPEAIVVPPRGPAYQEASQAVFAIFRTLTPQIEPLSVDEAFLDVTASGRLFGSGAAMAERVRAAIRTQTRLTASVGIAPNKFLAKLASDWRKPDGVFEIRAAEAVALLAPLPVTRIFGIGPAAAERLARRGIHHIRDVQALDLERAETLLGSGGVRLWNLARGQDDRPVVSDQRAKSIGQECTFGEDLRDPVAVQAVLDGHVEAIARRLRQAHARATTVQLKIRFGAFQTITRARSRQEASDRTAELLDMARALFRAWAETGFQPVRLIGASLSGLVRGQAPARLFPDPQDERHGRLDQALDGLRDRFGGRAVLRGNAGIVADRRQDGLDYADDVKPEGDGS